MHDDSAMIRGRNARKRALHRSGVSISLSRLSDRTINKVWASLVKIRRYSEYTDSNFRSVIRSEFLILRLTSLSVFSVEMC